MIYDHLKHTILVTASGPLMMHMPKKFHSKQTGIQTEPFYLEGSENYK